MSRFDIIWDRGATRAWAEMRPDRSLVLVAEPDYGPGLRSRHAVCIELSPGDVGKLIAALDAEPDEDAGALLSVYANSLSRPSLLQWMESVGTHPRVAVRQRLG